MLRRPGSPFLAVLLLALSGPRAAFAQDPDPAAARARAEAVLACITPKGEELGRFTRMLGEARTTLSQAEATPRARTDAAHAVTVLEARIRTTAEAIARCVESPAATTAPPPRVGAETVGTCGGTTTASSCSDESAPSGAAISDHVRAEPPTRVEGFGRLAPEAVMSAVRRVGPAIDECYHAFAERYAIVTGDAQLVFWTSPSGVVTEVGLEGFTMGDTAFRSCVTRAVRNLPSPGAAQGGPVKTRVHLRIGPD